MEQRTFSDTIPAFFQAANKPFKVIPQRDGNGQVVFLVVGEGISLKGLRSSIFALKGGQR